MKVVVYYRENLGWAFKLVASVGVSAGASIYSTKEEAINAASEQHPDKELEVAE